MKLKTVENMKKYTSYSDPQHGWLKVHKKELVGIEDQISGYSYMRGDYVYLEEDYDLTLFMRERNIDSSNIVTHHTDKLSKIRNYDSYKAYTDEQKIKINELRERMIVCKNWGKRAIKVIKNASLSSLEYWQSIYNF